MTSISSPTELFESRAVLFDSFDELLTGEGGQALSIDELIETAQLSGRVLLQADAGAGKSTLIRTLANREDETTRIVVRDLREVETVSSGRWSDPSEALLWLTQFTDTKDRRVLVCLDGLDEANPAVGQFLLEAVDDVSSHMPRTAFIVTDRVVRRLVRADRWKHVGLSSAADLEATTDDQPSTGDLPFYYLARRQVTGGEGRIDIHRRSLAIEKETLDELSNAALQLWREGESSLFSSDWFQSLVKSQSVENLMSVGILHSAGVGVLTFDHRLTHAYLAARALANNESDWTPDSFRAITQTRANYDALSLLLEIVPDDRVDELLQRVDAWSYRAAGHLLAEDRSTSRRVSTELASALVMLLGLRRLDPVPITRVQADDCLRLLQSDSLAQKVLEASRLEELQSWVPKLERTSDWWPVWTSVFLRESGDDATTQDIEVLTSDDSILGWTGSNVLHHLRLPPPMLKELAGLASDHPSSTVRWRAVHALEGNSTEESFQICLSRLDSDTSGWVQYGALRSAIVIASGISSKDKREQMLKQLGERAELINSDARYQVEAEQALQIDNPPEGWAETALPMIARLWELSATVEQQDRWSRLIAVLRTGWSDPMGLKDL